MILRKGRKEVEERWDKFLTLISTPLTYFLENKMNENE